MNPRIKQEDLDFVMAESEVPDGQLTLEEVREEERGKAEGGGCV